MITSDNPNQKVLGATVLKGLYAFGEKLTELNKKHELDNTETENVMAMLKQIINDA